MIFKKKQKDKQKILAVATGKTVPLLEVPDQVFSSEILGKGFAVDPSDGTVYSPVSGTVENVTESRHAYTIQSNDGLDVLIHIGIDTVELKGEGFTAMVSPGSAVKAGDIIARVDLERVRAGGYSALIPVIVTNPENAELGEAVLGPVIGGKSEILSYRIQNGK